MINIAVLGACGKMGQGILSILNSQKNRFKIVGAIDRENHSNLGKRIFEDSDIKFSSDLEAIINSIDVAIDFSFHEATIKNLDIFKRYKKSIVIGIQG